MHATIGALMALALGFFATLVGFARERSFSPIVTIAASSYYLLFALSGGARHVFVPEAVAMFAFAAVAVAGFRTSEWLVVAALVAHAIFDALHARAMEHPAIPAWWPGFCLAFDLAFAAFLAGLLLWRDPSQPGEPG